MAAFVKKGSEATPFSPSVRFILAKGLPMYHALLSLVVALGSIAAGSRSHEFRGERYKSPSKPRVNHDGGLWVGSWFAGIKRTAGSHLAK